MKRDLCDLAVLPARRRAALPAGWRSRTVETRDRMAAFEQLVGSYAAAIFPAALHGYRTAPALESVQAGWVGLATDWAPLAPPGDVGWATTW